MLLGDVLVAQGLVSPADIEVALERQRTQGGILGEHLIAMGKLDPADLQRVMGSAPPSPRNIEETGLSVNGPAEPRRQGDVQRRRDAVARSAAS